MDKLELSLSENISVVMTIQILHRDQVKFDNFNLDFQFNSLF